MISRAAATFVLAVVLAALAAGPASAGGWAVTTLDGVPAELRAGEPYQVGYTILQHGVAPLRGAETSVRARSESGQTLTFTGRAEGAPGHYVAEVRFPAAGAWTWEVVPGPFAPHQLGTVTVTLAAAAPAAGAAQAPVGEALQAEGTAVAPAAIVRASLLLAALFAGVAFAAQAGSTLRRRAARPGRAGAPESTTAVR